MLQAIINKINKSTGYNYQLDSLVDGELYLVHVPKVQPSSVEMAYGARPNPIERIAVGLSVYGYTLHERYGHIISWLNEKEQKALITILKESQDNDSNSMSSIAVVGSNNTCHNCQKLLEVEGNYCDEVCMDDHVKDMMDEYKEVK